MFKTRFISMLVLLMTAVTGATAQTEELLTTITMSGDGIIAYSVSGRATLSTSGLVETGMVAPEVYGWSNSSPLGIGSVTITAAEGYEITKVVFWNYEFMAGYNGDITDTASPFTCYLKGSMRSLNEDMSSGSSGNIGKIEVYGYAAAPAASTYTVTLKEGTEDANKWEIAPAEATTTGVAAGTEVKATYGGTKKVKSVKAKKKSAAPAEETVTWDNTNVFVSGNSEVTADKDNPYTYGGVSISFSGNSWLQLYDSGQDVTKLIVRADAVCTFTAPSGKKFTRIEITDNFYATFTAYGDWAMDGEAKAIWSGTASNTVTLGSSENSFFTNLKSIVFTMEEAAAPALNLTSPAVGQVIGDDGKNYDYASLPGGVTAVAKICYVSGSNGLALALADEVQMDWSTAISTCAAHTPAFTGGTWKLATKDEWTNMITAAGSYTDLQNGFSSVGGSNLDSSLWAWYWSSTENEENADNAWYYNFTKGWWDDGIPKDDGGMYVRACLAF